MSPVVSLPSPSAFRHPDGWMWMDGWIFAAACRVNDAMNGFSHFYLT